MVTLKPTKSNSDFIGVGLRPPYFDLFTEGAVKTVTWVEAITENFFFSTEILEKVRNHYDVHLHGVSLSLGSVDPLNLDYLKRLKELKRVIEPRLISDHLCWTGVDGINFHDLLPLPYTQETVTHVVERILKVQDFLGEKILVENLSSYVEAPFSEMREWEFVSEVVKKSGCGLLLDINNVYVSSVNHGFDPMTYLNSLPVAAVGQIHLAGHRAKENIIIDTHDEPISENVWKLFEKFQLKVPTMVERDENFPPWDVLEAELLRAARILNPQPSREKHESSYLAASV